MYHGKMLAEWNIGLTVTTKQKPAVDSQEVNELM